MYILSVIQVTIYRFFVFIIFYNIYNIISSLQKWKVVIMYNALGLLKASFKAFNPSMHINVSIGQRERPEILIQTAEEVANMIDLANDDLKKANQCFSATCEPFVNVCLNLNSTNSMM